MDKKELAVLALNARKLAYVPYSGHSVGAALLTKAGTVYTGCNIENAAYGPTVCAERVAIFKAVSGGEKEFAMIAVAGGDARSDDIDGDFPPCGVCRQVMAEFCEPDFPILVVTGTSENGPLFDTYTLEELLPHAFTPANL